MRPRIGLCGVVVRFGAARVMGSVFTGVFSLALFGAGTALAATVADIPGLVRVNNRDVKVASTEIEVAENEVKIARARYLPNIELKSTFTRLDKDVCKTKLFFTKVLMFLAMPSFVLSGFKWPAKAMPAVMRAIGHCLPLTYFVNSFRNIYLAAAPLKYVAGDIGMLCAFTAINLVVAYVAVQRVVRQQN